MEEFRIFFFLKNPFRKKEMKRSVILTGPIIVVTTKSLQSFNTKLQIEEWLFQRLIGLISD